LVAEPGAIRLTRSGGERRDECARSRPATAGSADEQERSARAHLAVGAASDVERQPEDLVDVAARLWEVDVGQPRSTGRRRRP
jgi:hypothetical protein